MSCLQAGVRCSTDGDYELAWSTNTGGSPSAGRVPFGLIAVIWETIKSDDREVAIDGEIP